MKRSLLLVFLLLLTLPLAVQAQDELPDLGGETISIAVENAYPPFNFIDEETGEPAGWDYDAVDEICARINCVPEYIETSWDGMIVAVSNGEFDVAADGITITEERDEIVDFSIPYVSIVERLMARVDEDRFATVEEFIANEELVVGVQLATTNYNTAIELVGEDRIVGYDIYGAAVQALIAGDVDAVIIDDVAGQGYVGENAEDVQLFEDGLTQNGGLGFIFPEGSELVAAFDAALTSMIDDGTLDELNVEWGVAGGEEEAVELPDLGGETISIAVENAYPPFNFIDEETGEPAGWDYDAVDEICARINCVPEYIETSWDGMIVAVSNGEFDVAADGITITEERDEIVDFSIPYVSIVERLMARVDEDRFATVDEFIANEELVVGVQLATTNYNTAIELVGEDRIVGYDIYGAAVQALIAGDVDAVIIDDVAGQGYVGENAEDVQLFEDGLTQNGGLGFIFPEGSELVAAFDAALTSMIDDGTLDELNVEWGVAGGEEE
ncbi:amino acid ABC transporter substrate-binding protein [Phototrophicus methaneseepsis]|uniref:Amino acid ABC transporter substrate-binding protein n=1 Tax=Phototrophicus methaneseepsis TaxID=2710758 RepID=A0A7S8E8J9_9CHLR|nr:ABC transporter substrate-binding protein [Phototrophicus methaneseepsis]QPC82375.1 amino acid ABC transporter substrate-binding protein [Phototrophicus methaneseepsis]